MTLRAASRGGGVWRKIPILDYDGIGIGIVIRYGSRSFSVFFLAHLILGLRRVEQTPKKSGTNNKQKNPLLLCSVERCGGLESKSRLRTTFFFALARSWLGGASRKSLVGLLPSRSLSGQKYEHVFKHLAFPPTPRVA